jgi:putative peptidoglycan lipid II flippase
MVPALSRAGVTNDRRKAFGAFFVVMVLLSVFVAAAGAAVSPLTLQATSELARSPQSLLISRISWIGAGASVLVGFLGALLNSQGKFLLPVITSALPYLGISLAVLAMAHSGPLSISVGLAGGALVAALVLLIGARNDFTVRGLGPVHYSSVRPFARAAPFALLSVLTFSVYPAIDAYWAPRLGPASLSTLGYCQRLLIAVAAIVAAGPSIVLQPRLAAAIASGDHGAFGRDLFRGLRMTILVCAPVAVGVSILALPLVRLAFERGAFDRGATLGVGGLLPWMLTGMIPMVLTVIVFKALYARHDTRTALYLGLLGPLIYFVGSGLAVSRAGLPGIGAAYLTTWTALALVGIGRLARMETLMTVTTAHVRELLVLLLAVALPALVARYAALAHWGTMSEPVLLLRLSIAGGIIAATFTVAAVYVARVDDLRSLFLSLRPRSFVR